MTAIVPYDANDNANANATLNEEHEEDKDDEGHLAVRHLAKVLLGVAKPRPANIKEVISDDDSKAKMKSNRYLNFAISLSTWNVSMCASCGRSEKPYPEEEVVFGNYQGRRPVFKRCVCGVPYCDSTCQEEDWSRHQFSCNCFRFAQREMVTTSHFILHGIQMLAEVPMFKSRESNTLAFVLRLFEGIVMIRNKTLSIPDNNLVVDKDLALKELSDRYAVTGVVVGVGVDV